MALKYIACAGNEDKGEQIARIFLMKSLAHTDGILLGNYHVPVNTSTLECDFVLFNRFGVWIIEVKNWHGRIEADQINWKRGDGVILHSPLNSVEIKAKKLYAKLREANFRNISVTGLVVMAQDNVKITYPCNAHNKKPSANKIFKLDEQLIQALTGRDYVHYANSRELEAELIERIVKKLVPQKVDPRQERIGDVYRIVADLGPSPDNAFYAYQAEHVILQGRYARAKKYSTHTARTTGELRHSIQHFQRDMQALMKMGHHPNIIQVYDYLPDRNSDDINWLMLEWIKGITLQDTLDTGPAIPYQEQLRILNAIVDGLDCCHSHNILHRNLTPSCIYLTNDGTAKIGDFDFARVPADIMETITFPGEPFVVKVNRHMAPELRTNARLADERSDLYALGAIWYDMVLHVEPDEDINLSRLAETELPPDARDLLSKLLASEPDERPHRAQAVKRWLEQI